MSRKIEFFSNADALIKEIERPDGVIHSYEVVGGKEQEKIILTSRPNEFKSVKEWEDRLNSMMSAGEVKNHDFLFTVPNDISEHKELEKNFMNPSYSLDGVFNYYTDYTYEMSEYDEKQLISFYMFYNNHYNQKYKNITALPNTKQLSKGKFTNFLYDLKRDYQIRSDDNINMLSNLIFGNDYPLSLNNSKKDNFPMYNKLSFSHDSELNILKNSIKKVDLLEQFICNIVYSRFVPSFLNTDNERTGIRYTNLSNIIDNFADFSDKKVILTKKNLSKTKTLNFIQRSILANSIVKDMIHHKTYKEIINRKPSNKEIIFFRVDKFSNSVIGMPVQTYHIPAFSNKIDLIDTQIFDDKEYHYVVTAYVLVYGTSYSYSDMKTINNWGASNMTDDPGPPPQFPDKTKNVTDGGGWNLADDPGPAPQWPDRPKNSIFKTEMSVQTRPSYRIYEIEYFRTSTIVAETPLNRPAALFVNSSNNKNNIFIKLGQQLSNSEAEFQTIETSDLAQVAGMTRTVHNNNKHKFKFQKIQASYQIYRSTKMPKSYTDMSGELLDEVECDYNKSTLTYEDIVLPEKKYYYMFRSVNLTGKVSNPSPIYEVELVKDAGDSYIRHKVVHLETERNKKRSEFFNKFLQIVPADEQAFIDMEDPLILGSDSYKKLEDIMHLGETMQYSIWDRKFKFRIRSKSTGKVLDFNIKFKLNKIRDIEDF